MAMDKTALYELAREKAREMVKAKLGEYLVSTGRRLNMNIKCPNTLNHKNGDRNPSARYYARSNSCYCYSCNENHDIIDFIKFDYSLSSDREAFDKAYELYGIDVVEIAKSIEKNESYALSTPKLARVEPQEAIYELEDGEVRDFTNICLEAHKSLSEASVANFKKRGLGDRIIEEYKLGYHAAGYNDFLKEFPEFHTRTRKEGLYNYIFPYPSAEGKFTYFLLELSDRSQMDDFTPKYRKISRNDTDITSQLFNERYIQASEKVIFICEGIYDALSFEELGFKAIALTGTGQNRLLGLIKKFSPNSRLIIALDNDGAGKKATERLTNGLDHLGIIYDMFVPDQKDINDDLVNDRKKLKERAEAAVKKILSVSTNTSVTDEDIKKAYIRQNCVGARVKEFAGTIGKSASAPDIPTGFAKLDECLDGGLYEGLYVIEESGHAGNTSFMIQVADQLAQSGQDVIIFTFELTRSEIMARSISRHTFLEAEKAGIDMKYAKTVKGITVGKRYKNYQKQEKDLIVASLNEYGKYSKHIYIREELDAFSLADLKQAVEQHVEIIGTRPVVFIDNLQAMPAYTLSSSEKETLDRNISELKRIARLFQIPIIATSTMECIPYTKEMAPDDMKIAYRPDVLIRLQVGGIERTYSRFNELVILKNRSERAGNRINIEHYTPFNYFREQNMLRFREDSEESDEKE